MTPPRVQLIQLARIYGLDRDAITGEMAQSTIAEHPERLAEALFLEAADNDDVTSIDTALTYLEDRLGFFGELVAGHEPAITATFRERLRAWET